MHHKLSQFLQTQFHDVLIKLLIYFVLLFWLLLILRLHRTVKLVSALRLCIQIKFSEEAPTHVKITKVGIYDLDVYDIHTFEFACQLFYVSTAGDILLA